MLIIKQQKDKWYRVCHLFTNYSDQEYDTLNKALDLCRLRCNTNLKENKIKVIKVPLIGFWLVW